MSDDPQVPDGEGAGDAPPGPPAAAPEAEGSPRDPGTSAEDALVAGAAPLASDSQRVLNSEEVDALLKGLSHGNIPLPATTSGHVRVRPYDLANPESSEWAPMPALDLIAERAVPGMALQLTRRLSFAVRTRSLPIQVRDYGRFLRSFEPPVAISILTMSPGAAGAVLMVGAQTVYRMIDLIFGGKPSEVVNRSLRDFTRIEMRTVGNVVRDVLKGLTAAWQEIVPVGFEWQRLETRPQFATILPPTEQCVLMQWEVDLGVGDGDQIVLCVPVAALDQMPQLREQIAPEDGEESHARARKRMRANLRQVPLQFTVRLGEVAMPIGRVRALKVGDVIPLGKRPSDPVVGLLEGVPKFHGVTGVYRGSRALQITKVLDRAPVR
jgi:flagellar motor switch protein FliM